MGFHYKFKTIGISDYELVLTTETNNRLINTLFIQAKRKLLSTVAQNANFNLEDINKFDIDKRYNGFLKTTILSQLSQIKKEVGRDKIKILNSSVVNAHFQRKEDNKDVWTICIEVTGQYLDDRVKGELDNGQQ